MWIKPSLFYVHKMVRDDMHYLFSGCNIIYAHAYPGFILEDSGHPWDQYLHCGYTGPATTWCKGEFLIPEYLQNARMHL